MYRNKLQTILLMFPDDIQCHIFIISYKTFVYSSLQELRSGFYYKAVQNCIPDALSTRKPVVHVMKSDSYLKEDPFS